MASRSRDIGTANRSTRSRTARGEAVTRGGTPAAALGVGDEQIAVQERLAQQREVNKQQDAEAAPARTEAAAARAMPDAKSAPTSGVFTVVCRNGLPHRRNGIIFSGEAQTVDTSNWTEAEKQRFFNDGLLIIVPGSHLGAQGALLAPARSFPATMTGGAGENATPEMLDALQRGEAMPHPSSGSANPVVGGTVPTAARDLEKQLNSKNG